MTTEQIYEQALKRIVEYEHLTEGTATTWKDVAQFCKRIALEALQKSNSQNS